MFFKSLHITTILIIIFCMMSFTIYSQPEMGWMDAPFHDIGTYRITAAFDLDRVSSIADWTGWKSGDPTAGYGHAYDDHTGTDWGMANFTDLYNVYSGTCTWLRENIPNNTNNNAGEPGNGVTMSHSINSTTYKTLHYHLAYNSVVPAVNDTLGKDVKIGESDHTGHSTGPHLHFSVSKESGSYTCGFYHGWFEDDEFYYGDERICLRYVKISGTGSSLNCRRGTSTSYDIVTTANDDSYFVACERNDWYRFFAPMPPAKAYESRDGSGSLAGGYSENGSWTNSTEKSSVTDPQGDANYVSLQGSGSRYSTFTGTGDSGISATHTFTAPQRGYYDIYATWPSDANAADVTYHVTDSNGTQDVVLDQPGMTSSGGSGTHADPYIIDTVPYTADHTTVGGDDTWDSYSPTGSGIDESGPERIYKLEIFETTDINITVDHTGYPGLDVDVHLLTSLSNSSCVARADWEVDYSSAAPGTYYIAIDSYGGDSTATNYTIEVTLDDGVAYPDSWVKLGQFFYANGASGSVEIQQGSVTGKVDSGRDGRVYADAIKVVPVITYRSIWASNSYMTVVPGTTLSQTERMGCVGIKVDQTTNNDSREITEYSEIPVYAAMGSGSTNTSAIVAKAVTGQRFVCDKVEGGWYRIFLTNGCDASKGWIHEDLLFGYRLPWVLPVELSVFNVE